MSTVSRQSAFWAVITLGLNLFPQEPGVVLGNDREVGRQIRTSPLVCLADSLIAVFEFAYLLCKGCSWRRSITTVALVRGMRDVKEPVDISRCPTGRCKEIKIEISTLPAAAEEWRRMHHEVPSRCFCPEAQSKKDKRVPEERWWLRVILFAFGALPQTIKLLAARGAPWLQLTGMSYVISYLVTEAIDKFAGEHDLSHHPTLPVSPGTLWRLMEGPEILESQVQVPDVSKNVYKFVAHKALGDERKRWLLYVILAAQVGLFVHIFHDTSEPSSTGWHAHFDPLSNTMLWIVISLLSVPIWITTGLLVRSYKSLEDREKSTLYKMLSLHQRHRLQEFILRFPKWIVWIRLGISLSTCGAIIALVSPRNVRLTFFQTQGYLSWAFVQGLILRFVRSRVRGPEFARLPFQVWLSDSFALWNLQTALLYYAYMYDPDGTFKPGWTDFFG